MYTDIRRHLRVTVRRKRHEKWRTNSCFAFTAMLQHTGRFWSKNSVTALEDTPYSPDLAPAAFYLFSRLKLALKGRRFCDTTDIMMRMTEEPKRLLRNGFQECFFLKSLGKVYSCTRGLF